MKRLLVFLGILSLVLGMAGVAAAIQIGPGAFGPGASFESFEGISPGPNVEPLPANPNYLVPGVTGPFTFGSGVTLTDPIPNPIHGPSD
jgi:hypothetical protein